MNIYRTAFITALIGYRLVAVSTIASPDKVYAVFRNDSGKDVKVRVESKAGYSLFGISPGVVFTERVSPSSQLTVNVTGGRKLIRPVLVSAAMFSANYDRKHGACYFRITKDRIDIVAPNDAPGWWEAGLALRR